MRRFDARVTKGITFFSQDQANTMPEGITPLDADVVMDHAQVFPELGRRNRFAVGKVVAVEIADNIDSQVVNFSQRALTLKQVQKKIDVTDTSMEENLAARLKGLL